MIDHEFDDIEHDDFEREVTRIPQNKKVQQQLENNILKHAELYLEDITEDEHDFLIRTLQNLAVDEPYFSVLADELNQPVGSKVANDALNLLHFWQVVHEVEDLSNFNLLNVVNGEFFQSEMLKVFDEMEIGEHQTQRRAVLLEALKLYKLGFYAGCTPILYAQLEGILTDTLLQQGFLKQSTTKFIDVYKVVPGLKGNEIKSLWHKAKIAAELNHYFLELAAYQMDSSSNVSSTRHNILHGTELNYFTQGRCFILFVWLFSAISFIRTIK